MKKIFIVLLLSVFLSPVFAQQKRTEVIGIWKITVKTSGLKRPPPPEYILMMDDSIYMQGVDSIGNSLTGVSSGRWTVQGNGNLVLYPSDRIAETRFYRPSGENRFTFESSRNQRSKNSPPMLEMDIYLEKIIRKEGE